jgi:hypothetical protein
VRRPSARLSALQLHQVRFGEADMARRFRCHVPAEVASWRSINESLVGAAVNALNTPCVRHPPGPSAVSNRRPYRHSFRNDTLEVQARRPSVGLSVRLEADALVRLARTGRDQKDARGIRA